MKIFIMRHGEAEVVASSDEARHLTEYGRKQSISPPAKRTLMST